jgi:hypothetical protein
MSIPVANFDCDDENDTPMLYLNSFLKIASLSVPETGDNR